MDDKISVFIQIIHLWISSRVIFIVFCCLPFPRDVRYNNFTFLSTSSVLSNRVITDRTPAASTDFHRLTSLVRSNYVKDSVIYPADREVIVGNMQEKSSLVAAPAASSAPPVTVAAVATAERTTLRAMPVVKVDATASLASSALRHVVEWTHFGTDSSERSLSSEKFTSRNLVLGRICLRPC